MLPNKKILKLSRAGSQSRATQSSLDDSMDDFLMTRPSKSDRKATKVVPAAKLLIAASQLPESCDVIEKVEATTSVSEAKDKGTVDEKPLKRPKPLENADKKVRRPRKKAVDESDLSLAIALSESLVSANENARRKEEEILMKEDLVEVLSVLRQEETTAAGGSVLAQQILPQPPPIPLVTVKRKPKSAGKKKRDDYILLSRSQRERERIIADAAASVLSRGDAPDPLRPLDLSFINSEPLSDYLRRYQQKNGATSTTKTSLWQLAGLKESAATNGSERETFYIEAMRSFSKSPAKERKRFTGGLFHVSQLPGRAASQRAHLTASTQDVLEELALKADGGFVEDDIEEPRNAEGGSISLVQDWSNLIDNPYLSDTSILTKDSRIHAHFLVLAVRCPALVANSPKSETPIVIDWSEYSSGSALVVIRYIYTAEFLPATSGRSCPNQVWRIAQRCQLSKLIDLINPVFREEDKTIGVEDYQTQVDTSASISEADLSRNTSGLPSRAVGSFAMDSTLGQGNETLCMEECVADVPDLPENPVFEQGSRDVSMEECRPESSSSGSVTEIDISVSPRRAKRSVTPDLFADEEKTKEEEDLIDLTQEESDGIESKRKSDTSGTQKSSSLESIPAVLNSTRCRADADEIVSSNFQLIGNASEIDPDPDPDPDRSSSYGRFQDETGGAVSPNVHLIGDTSDADRWIDPDPYPDLNESTGFSRFHEEIVISVADADAGPCIDPDPSESSDNERLLNPATRRLASSSSSSSSGSREILHTPQGARLAKKRKIDPVTPQPDYQTMPTPSLKKELEKFGLKPLKRKNAVKLLQHIYDELHPMVTDTESSFQETPTQPKATGPSHKNKQRSSRSASASASSSGSGGSDDGSDSEDEQTTIVEEMDQDTETGDGSSEGNDETIPLKERLRAFLKSRPDIFQQVLSYEPILFEWLCKEIRKAGIRCKAAQVLDWVDEECITCRMKTRSTKRSPAKENSPEEKNRRVCSKKLIS